MRGNAGTTRTDPLDRLETEVFDFSGRSRSVEPLTPGLLVPIDHQMNEKQSGEIENGLGSDIGVVKACEAGEFVERQRSAFGLGNL
jgi:hypothetical protein